MSALDMQLMKDSYRNISFSPERRGEQDHKHYTELLASDLAELKDTLYTKAEERNDIVLTPEIIDERLKHYEQKFCDLVMTMYHRQSRCASTMIVGPGNFHLGRHAKTHQSHMNSIEQFTKWREGYFKAVERKRTLSPEAEIDATLAELDRLELRREAFIEIRELAKAIDKTAMVEKAKEYYEMGLFKEMYFKVFTEEKIFYQFMMTNLNTKIRGRKKKLEVMRSRIKAKSNFEALTFNGGRIDIENDRIVVYNDSKPERSVIDAIKSYGFRYSPKTRTWVRKHTGNARYDAQNLHKRLKEMLGEESAFTKQEEIEILDTFFEGENQ